MQLDMFAPADGNYGLRILSGDPQMWRDAVGSNPAFPYDLGALGSITGTNAGSSAYYYFFYDWEVSSPITWCEGPRTAVQVLVGPTGIASHETGTGIRMFPNPAADRVTLTGDLPAGASVAEFLDVAGRVCMKADLRSKDSRVVDSAMQ